MTRNQKWLLLGIFLIAFFFRFYQIGHMPGGLFPDEAANGLDINLMEQGHLQPFYERGNGREALFFYMEWASSAIFGKGPWQFHIVSASVGFLATILCFFFTKTLFCLGAETQEKRNRAIIIALLAAFLMATNAWHVVLSRTAFRANLIPLFSTLAMYLMLLIYTARTFRKRLVFGVLFGASFGLGFYTYIAYRMMPLIVGAGIGIPFLIDIFKTSPKFLEIKKYIGAGTGALFAFLASIAPLAWYFYTHPGSFIGRSGQVSIFNPELNQGHLLLTLFQVIKASLLGFITQGDLNWRHNISGFPFLSQVVSPFFVIGLLAISGLGLVYVFYPRLRAGFWKYFLLAAWFWGMLIPVITTAEGIPHGLRSIGMIPPVFIITAWGLYESIGAIRNAIKKRHANGYFDDSLKIPAKLKTKVIHAGLKTVAVVFFATVFLQTYILYFVYAANSPENFYAFRSDLTVVSNFLKDNGSREKTYLVLDKFSVQTTDFLTTLDPKYPESPKNRPYTQVDPEDSWKLSGLKPEDEIIFAQSSIFDIKKFKQYHPNAHLTQETRNKFEQTVMAVYKIY